VGQEVAGEVTVDAEVKALFNQHGLGAVCVDVCGELGVTSLNDLQNHVTAQDVDNLPKHVKDKLKPAQKSKLKALIGRQPPAAEEGTLASTSTSVRTHASAATKSVEKSRNGGPSARRIYAFFAKHVDDSINVHGEAQRVMQDLQHSYWWDNLELNCFALATFEGFRDAMRNCPARNVFMAYFSGHCSEGGQLCFSRNESGSEMEMRDPEDVAFCIAGASRDVATRAGGGTIECVLLNACHTYSLAVALRRKGVRYVVCWHPAIKDSIAKKFAEEFLRELVVNPTDYRRAFEAGQIEVKSLSPEAARGLCFLSVDGDVNSDVPEKDHEGAEEEERLRRERAETEQQEKERIKREKEEAKLKAREEKDRIKAEKAAAAKKVAEELAAAAKKVAKEAEEAAKAAEEAAASSLSESDDDEEETEAGARDGDGDTEA
jgi:hypothetical protein